MRQRGYEYLIVSRRLYGPDETTGKEPPSIGESDLNKYGQEGWELCGLINAEWKPGVMDHLIPNAQLIFKRPKLIKRVPSG